MCHIGLVAIGFAALSYDLVTCHHIPARHIDDVQSTHSEWGVNVSLIVVKWYTQAVSRDIKLIGQCLAVTSHVPRMCG